MGADLVGWVYGLGNMVYATYDQPGFLRQMLNLVAERNRRRMEVVLDAGMICISSVPGVGVVTSGRRPIVASFSCQF